MRNCNCRRRYNQNFNNNCGCRNRNNMNYFNMYNQNNSNCCYMNANTNNNCSNPFPDNFLYGHAYTPTQNLRDTFDPQTGLDNGSMFPELVSPYYPGQSMDFIEYLKTTGRNGGCGCE